VPLSNNAAERAVRGPVDGRITGCTSVRGTEVAAILDTLLESAKLARIEPRSYLRDAAQAALTGGPQLLPHNYRDQLRATACDHAQHRGQLAARFDKGQLTCLVGDARAVRRVQRSAFRRYRMANNHPDHEDINKPSP
jgi:hypothetical protein